MNIPTTKLNNGVEIPMLGLGVWRAEEGQEVENAVTWALKAGYRLIDTAKAYGNEAGVGRALANSGIPRKEIKVTTKLWSRDQGYKSTLAAIDESLQKLQLDYVDLYLIHWPILDPLTGENRRTETWEAMEEIYKVGKAKAIGVSNYTIEHLEEMRSYSNITPAVNQVEFHPFLFQKELMEYCKAQNIVLEAYSPLTRGQKLQDIRITEVAKKYGKSNAQILLRWSIQHGNIVIPKSTNKMRIEENIDIFNFELTAEDMKILDNLNEGFKIVRQA